MVLSAQRILEAWDQGASSTTEGKIQLLLSLAKPVLSTAELLDLVLGERNNILLELYQYLFGSNLKAYIECNECGGALDLEFAIDDFGFASMGHLPETHSVSQKNITAQVRLPNSYDLTALECVDNIEDGRRILFSQCVLELHKGDVAIVLDQLNEEELDLLEEAIFQLDPRMEIVFDLQCPHCAYKWQSPLELGSFLWLEFDAYARQLLENVHLLAISYGWSESDILAMSQKRRHFYLQRIIQ